jgi:hypothetical protein
MYFRSGFRELSPGFYLTLLTALLDTCLAAIRQQSHPTGFLYDFHWFLTVGTGELVSILTKCVLVDGSRLEGIRPVATPMLMVVFETHLAERRSKKIDVIPLVWWMTDMT